MRDEVDLCVLSGCSVLNLVSGFFHITTETTRSVAGCGGSGNENQHRAHRQHGDAEWSWLGGLTTGFCDEYCVHGDAGIAGAEPRASGKSQVAKDQAARGLDTGRGMRGNIADCTFQGIHLAFCTTEMPTRA